MKHLFIPYKLAVKLKEKGFDEPCFSWYLNKKLETKPNAIFYFTHSSRSHEGYKSVQRQEFISAPLYQQVVDWFREKHNIRSYIDQRVTSVDSPNEWVYDFVVKTGDGITDKPFFSGDYNSYQEAQIGCINYMIKLIL